MVALQELPSPRTCAVCEVVVNLLSPIMIGLVLNQSHGHWLFGDVLQFVISKTCEVCDELANVVILNNLGDLKVNAFGATLIKLVIHMKH
jgi:hypothetical protein